MLEEESQLLLYILIVFLAHCVSILPRWCDIHGITFSKPLGSMSLLAHYVSILPQWCDIYGILEYG